MREFALIQRVERVARQRDVDRGAQLVVRDHDRGGVRNDGASRPAPAASARRATAVAWTSPPQLPSAPC
ncbi:MAG: hypothetical protein AABZ84_03540, partial [Pseudomonadota bacterium]